MTKTRTLRRLLPLLALTALLATPLAAQAWWNKDWSARTRITLDTGDKGLPLGAAVSGVPLAVRLHSGNFDFASAKDDGSDLRVLAGDDKTPLKFHIERFDAANELAVLWVQLPQVAPGSDKNQVYVYTGNGKATADAANAGGFDADTLAAFHFSDPDAAAQGGKPAKATGFVPEANAQLAGGAKLAGTPIVWPAGEVPKWASGAALSWSLWAKPGAAAGTAKLVQIGPMALTLADGKLVARVGSASIPGGAVPAGQWSHLAVTAAQGKVRLFINGAPAGEGDAGLPELAGELRVGEGFNGLIDELQLARTARPADWWKLAAASQGVDSPLVRSAREDAGTAEEGHGGYFGILFANLTTDAWIVIGILAAMFVLAATVMVTKLLFVSRTDKANRGFVAQFRSPDVDLLKIEGAGLAGSSLYRLYQAGVRELAKREAALARHALSSASLDAVKAAVDADMVRETHRLNAQMVWLTIAISGGPFLGLLGTVVGVMITFAAIAAAGDVNVNAIAPGIAAALLATVAGLGVAIPALFGYNYLASRIKNLSSDMQIFVDEFITRVAETYSAS